MPEILTLENGNALFVLPRGGRSFIQPCQKIQASDLPALQDCAKKWPQENRTVVEAIRRRFESTPNQTLYLACETAFFAQLPDAAASYALPTAESTKYQRFGADGLMHAWVAAHHPELSKIISVNLAANTSLAAICDGKAIDCSSGYSLLSGLPGLTICGEIDPSLVLFLAEQGWTLNQISEMLYRQSGWQSFSPTPLTFPGFLTDSAPRVELARSMYIHGLVKQIGAMLAELGGAERVIIICESASAYETLVEKMRCHFQPYELAFELIEVSKKEVLVSLVHKIQSLDMS